MIGDTAESLSPNPNLGITIEEGSNSSEKFVESNDLEIDANELELAANDLDLEETEIGIQNNDLENECDRLLELDSNSGHHDENRGDTYTADGDCAESQGKTYQPPFAGMEFDSYDDAYSHYNSYARELGFAIRVKSSWTKRNSKEKRGAVLCCNCEGFKTAKEANSRRKETRMGCLAMIRLRLVEANRWKVDEVKLEHNHPFDPERAQNSKSHKKTSGAAKRKLEQAVDVQVRMIKLYRRPPIDAPSLLASNSSGEMSDHNLDHTDHKKRLELKHGDFKVLQDFFYRIQLTKPNFLYLMDLSNNGFLRNVFWIEPRSRAAYSYFNDVVAFDTTCLSSKYDLPLVAFIGINHHGDLILLGCALLVDQTFETYLWLFRAWLTCMSGRPPQTVVTEQCCAIQSAVSEVFPRAHHRLSLAHIFQTISQSTAGLGNMESFHTALTRVVYGSVKVEEFEMAWEEMVSRFGLANHDTMRCLFQDRERWAPVYVKEAFFIGLRDTRTLFFFFDGYVHEHMSLREFCDGYESFLEKKYKTEAILESESSDAAILDLKTTHRYESQIARCFTREIFRRFQDEVIGMASCFEVTQVHANGSSCTTYTVKEEEGGGDKVRDFEVLYDATGTGQVRCVCTCGCFSFNGYPCRHALCVLSHNGLDQVPDQYVLKRWRRDVSRRYVAEFGWGRVDVGNPVQRYEHLQRRAMEVVEQGMRSKDHCRLAWEALKDSLFRVRLLSVSDRPP